MMPELCPFGSLYYLPAQAILWNTRLCQTQGLCTAGDSCSLHGFPGLAPLPGANVVRLPFPKQQTTSPCCGSSPDLSGLTR